MTTQGGLSGQTIFRFYLPLALSWLFMGLEGPVAIKLISNLREPELNTAAFSILMSLAIWIEAPVIDLLSTSTTLARDRARYELISRFIWYLMLWVTVAHALVTFTPLYFVVTEGVLGVKHDVALAARPGMAIMTLWSAFIGWRRYLQGMLIRRGQTRVIGIGTTLRVSTIILASILLFNVTEWNGVVIASTALLSSVVMESIFIHFVSRRVVTEVIHQPPMEVGLSMRQLATFHFPLTATTMVKLMVTPIIIAGLARTAEPVLAITAYQVCSTIMFLHRALGFCLPEVVIALYKDRPSRIALRNFCTVVALSTSGSMLLLSLTGGGSVYLCAHFERQAGADGDGALVLPLLCAGAGDRRDSGLHAGSFDGAPPDGVAADRRRHLGRGFAGFGAGHGESGLERAGDRGRVAHGVIVSRVGGAGVFVVACPGPARPAGRALVEVGRRGVDAMVVAVVLPLDPLHFFVSLGEHGASDEQERDAGEAVAH